MEKGDSSMAVRNMPPPEAARTRGWRLGPVQPAVVRTRMIVRTRIRSSAAADCAHRGAAADHYWDTDLFPRQCRRGESVFESTIRGGAGRCQRFNRLSAT
jgi:hypothetical protein